MLTEFDSFDIPSALLPPGLLPGEVVDLTVRGRVAHGQLLPW